MGCEAAPATVADAFKVTSGVVRSPVPGTDKSVGYFKIENQTDQDWRLVSASSGIARTVEMHSTEQVEGISRMRRLKQVSIPAGATILFAPGGHHLMLFGVEDIGTHAPVRLNLVDQTGQEIQLDRQFEVVAFNASITI